MTDHESKAIGERIGNYRLVRLVGSGGFADVYLGEHQHLGTYAAIKVLHTKLSGEQIELFRQEARTLAHLLHPHIVRVLDFDVENQFPFLVMDYAPGGTLRQQHPRGTIVPLPTVIGYLRQVASALDYAHNQKLIHRDVKPENMLIDQQGQIMLSDFGVAYMVHSSRSQTLAELAGTISYIAPEQIQGRPHLASDQYALGVVIYEWLSGERPFQGSVTEIVSQHLVAPPPPLHGRIAGISPTVENVLFTALEKNPRDRFATVQTFVRAFEQAFRDGSTVVAYPSSTIDVYDVHEDITQPSQAISAQRASLPTPVPLAKLDDAAFVSPSPITPFPPNKMSPIPSTPVQSFAGEPSEPLAQPSAQADEVPVLLAQQMESSGLAERQPIAASTPSIAELMRLAQQRWPGWVYLSTAPHARRNLLVAGGIVFLLVLLIASNTLYALTHASAHPTRTAVTSTIGLTATATQATTMPPTSTTSKVASFRRSVPNAIPTPMATSISKAVPTPTPTPETTATPEPTPTPETTATPEPTPTPTPEPTPTPVPTPTPTPTPICPAQIQYGSVGTEVKTLQSALNNHSFPDSPYIYTRPLGVDGQFGPQVQAAVKDFQTANGLQVDGQVGPLTWHALGYC